LPIREGMTFLLKKQNYLTKVLKQCILLRVKYKELPITVICMAKFQVHWVSSNWMNFRSLYLPNKVNLMKTRKGLLIFLKRMTRSLLLIWIDRMILTSISSWILHRRNPTWVLMKVSSAVNQFKRIKIELTHLQSLKRRQRRNMKRLFSNWGRTVND
jgi:hypothetical protein